MSVKNLVWDTLSKIDVSKHIEKKANLSYLSWSWAWATLMEHYPESDYEFHPLEIGEDGTVTVSCTVRVLQTSRMMWLPVMDNRNNSIKNPDSRKISDAKMRCLVKCIAMHGLGLYIYAGEDLPEAEPSTPPAPKAQSKAHTDTNEIFETAITALKTADSMENLLLHFTAAKAMCNNKQEVGRVVAAKDARKAELSA